VYPTVYLQGSFGVNVEKFGLRAMELKLYWAYAEVNVGTSGGDHQKASSTNSTIQSIKYIFV
jgi:hypothetical protein